MIRRPFKADWDVSQLPPNRQEDLECTSFEQRATRIAGECKITHISVARYRDPAPDEPKDARQVVFRFCVSEQACDIFFNAPDGLRGRYWQSGFRPMGVAVVVARPERLAEVRATGAVDVRLLSSYVGALRLHRQGQRRIA
jgi:hypothetical protein